MRIDKNIKERIHDPYSKGLKHTEGIYCPECNAIYHGGRWIWPENRKATGHGEPLLCSACRRIRDSFPAGEVHLSGNYLSKHKDEIQNLIYNVVKELGERSPLKRMMGIQQLEKGIVVRFTDDHLARHIGDAVYHAYKGDLKLKYSDEEKFVRLYWHRDE